MSIDTRTIIGKAIRSVSLFEGLENRQLMSAGVTFENNTLTVTGTPRNDNIHLSWTDAGRSVRVSLNGQLSKAFDGRQLWTVNVNAGNGNNRVTVDRDFRANVNVTTGKGNDTITTGLGNDFIQSGAGKDRVDTGSGNDIVWSGSGNDTLNGGAGDDLLVAESGDDVVDTGGNGSNTVYAGAGKNKLVTTGNDQVDDGASQGGQSQIVLSGASATPTTPSTPELNTRIRVDSISLINADTGKVVSGYENLTGTVTLDLAKLPARFTLVANVTGKNVGSTRFQLGGNASLDRVENSEPMTLTPSINGGKFEAWSPAAGSYTLSVTPFLKDDAKGTAGPAKTISINVKAVVAPSAPAEDDTETPVDTGAPVIATNAFQGTTITAGESFHIEATGTVIPGADVEDASFAWDFGDAGSRYNQMPGFNAAHVYERPGTYTVKLTVTAPNGQVSQQTTTVTVNASTAKTLYVSANGNDSANGAYNTPLRTLARAVALSGNDTTILLRRGDTFWQSSTVEIKKNGVTVSSYGTGSDPTIMWTGARDRSNILWVNTTTSNVTVRGLRFDSIYNGDTEQTGMPTAILAGGSNVVVRENTFLNIGYCVNANQKPKGLIVQDNRAPSEVGVRDYLVWTQGSDIVIVGNEVANSTREHNVRVSGADRLVIAFNKLTNLDRTSSGDAKDNGKGTIVSQKGSYAYIADNQMRGPAGVGPLGGGDGLGDKGARFTHARVEDNVQYEGTFFVNHGADHITLTGNTLFRDDAIAFDIAGWNAAYGRGNSDVVIDKNIAVNNGIKGYGNFLMVESTTQGITLTDNVYVAPYLAPGAWGAAAVYVTAGDLTSFSRIDGNTWPATSRANSYAQGGMNFIGLSYNGSGHQDENEWNTSKAVGNDLFLDVTLDGARRLAA